MPKSSRYGRAGGLPATLQRSCAEAQELFIGARASAVETYGEGDQADLAAFEVLKQKFDKRGDHWVAKRKS